MEHCNPLLSNQAASPRRCWPISFEYRVFAEADCYWGVTSLSRRMCVQTGGPPLPHLCMEPVCIVRVKSTKQPPKSSFETTSLQSPATKGLSVEIRPWLPDDEGRFRRFPRMRAVGMPGTSFKDWHKKRRLSPPCSFCSYQYLYFIKPGTFTTPGFEDLYLNHNE